MYVKTLDSDERDKALRNPVPTLNNQSRTGCLGPGRAAPALSDLCVEPQKLDFWNLERSFALTPQPPLFICPKCMKRIRRRVRLSVVRGLSPSQRFACLTVASLMLIPWFKLSESAVETGRICRSARCACEWCTVLIVPATHLTRARHSRAQSPQIPGKTVFFVVETGRSPPSLLLCRNNPQ